MVTRIAVVEKDLCNPSKCQLECIHQCPVNRNGKDCIVLSKDGSIAVIDEGLCTGCGICIRVCPFHAINIVNLVAPVEDKLAYSYGENSFDLYGFALPKKGIIGIVGENGCGKSTNVKLITGRLKPTNLYSKESRAYFGALKKDAAVYKPQELGSTIKGKVSELLAKVDESGRLKELSKLFDLDILKDRDLSQLSGGELQRVFIAAALCREKASYVLDEPLAFLDYAYRLRLIEYLRENFSNKQVIVVDHDISLLSYLCDQVYLNYGVPGAYGIVSQPYATDRAINMFLDGYIEPENVRFRGEIRYKDHAPEKRSGVAAKIPALKLKRGSFTLENASEIALHPGEVVGIAGPNGTGKSTLCNELAKALEGVVSLKPQILSRPDEFVGTFLDRDTPFKESFVRQMNLQRLEFLSLRQLSGGELQKTAVFRCLADDSATLFVLDEPSNMMDVTGRIALSKLLREKAVTDDVALLVVDHDLEFLYNTCDRLIIFGGEPAKHGTVDGVYSKGEGVKKLLSHFDLSYRKDEKSRRLKLNKHGSVKDRALKESGEFVEG